LTLFRHLFLRRPDLEPLGGLVKKKIRIGLSYREKGKNPIKKGREDPFSKIEFYLLRVAALIALLIFLAAFLRDHITKFF